MHRYAGPEVSLEATEPLLLAAAWLVASNSVLERWVLSPSELAPAPHFHEDTASEPHIATASISAAAACRESLGSRSQGDRTMYGSCAGHIYTYIHIHIYIHTHIRTHKCRLRRARTCG
jgi:hypothetical protein